jgi:RNA polymerase sigma-70 factor, ECF subfamily
VGRQTADLVMALQGGDESAFVELYERHKRAVYLFCVKMLGDQETASDVTQGVFIKVLERRHQLSDATKFAAWLLTMTRNDCLRLLYRRNVTGSLDDPPLDFDRIIVAEDSDPVTDEDIRAVNQAVEQLRPEFREVIFLREYQNLSYREIAEVISATESTVKFRLFAARRELHKRLNPFPRGRSNELRRSQ